MLPPRAKRPLQRRGQLELSREPLQQSRLRWPLRPLSPSRSIWSRFLRLRCPRQMTSPAQNCVPCARDRSQTVTEPTIQIHGQRREQNGAAVLEQRNELWSPLLEAVGQSFRKEAVGSEVLQSAAFFEHAPSSKCRARDGNAVPACIQVRREF